MCFSLEMRSDKFVFESKQSDVVYSVYRDLLRLDSTSGDVSDDFIRNRMFMSARQYKTLYWV